MTANSQRLSGDQASVPASTDAWLSGTATRWSAPVARLSRCRVTWPPGVTRKIAAMAPSGAMTPGAAAETDAAGGPLSFRWPPVTVSVTTSAQRCGRSQFTVSQRVGPTAASIPPMRRDPPGHTS